MTAKEKADYLIDQFEISGVAQAKRMALITVAEIIEALDFVQNDVKEFMIKYWMDVATEIKNYKP